MIQKLADSSRNLAIASTLLLATLAGVAVAEPINVDNPPQGRFADDWLEVHMLGGKVGYGHSTMSRDGDQIQTRTTMFMRLGRVDMPVEVSTEQETVETLDGRPMSFTSRINAANTSTLTAGRIHDRKVDIETSQFGMKQTQTYDYVEGGLMTWGLFRETLKRGLNPGLTFTVKSYSPEFRLDAPIDVHVSIKDWETFEHNGPQKGLKVLTKMQSPMGEIEMTSWVDENGTPLKAVMPAPGLGNLEIYAVDEQKALAEFVPPEMFMSSSIKAGTSIDRHAVRKIVYRVKSKDDKIDMGTFPETDTQSVRKTDEGVVIEVHRQDHAPEDGKTAGNPDDLKEYVGSNLMINVDDPKLIELAREAAGEEKNPYKLADKLRRFVTDYITEKNLSVAFATASEVCRSREGDCSEHGVLLAALGRINGLPSRVVAGLAYVPLFGQQQDIFGYHMWTEFLIDGRWVCVDAALRETECSPARITMAVSSLQNSGMADLSLPLLNKIGAIDLEIVSIDGKPIGQD